MIAGGALRRGAFTLVVLTLTLASSEASAQVVAAEPVAPIEPLFPPDAPAVETQVVLQLVVDAAGHVESAVPTARAPVDAPSSFDAAATEAAKQATFRPSTRDGRPMRSRVEYVVVFRPPAPVPAAPPPPAPSPAPMPTPAPTPATPTVSTNEQDEDYAQVVQVRGAGWSSPRGVGDLRIKRDLLEASPRQQTSEMLSSAPGFFVDHEDGEGIGNDVFLRGFDLEHGSGIEMRVGNVPINSPIHVQGQGYADANFIIPEVVRSVRVLGGPFDPRQGDAAIVGSAYFDLGVAERRNALKATYGSFNQFRLLGIAAPEGADDETFAAFAVRTTDGFGENRASQSGTLNAQYGVDIGSRDHVRLLATAYGVRSTLPGVVRQTDVDSGAIGFYDSYPFFTQGQGVQTSRVIVGVDFDHVAESGGRIEFAPWAMWTDFRARENFSGNIFSSQINPQLAGGTGDLWETTNREAAVGVTSRFHSASWHVGSWLEAAAEPGVYARAGHTDQTKSLISPQTLQAWDRRLDDGLDTLDAAGYLDLDLRFWKRLRLSGGVRGDLLYVNVNDRLGYDAPAQNGLPGSQRATQAVAVSPRVTVEYDITRAVAPVVSYGEGFRSLDATASAALPSAMAGAVSGGAVVSAPGIQEGSTPFSKVRSVEAGLRAQTPGERYTATLSAFETWVANELVFEATSGGFTTQGPSLRRGLVASAVARPVDWLLVSAAASAASATFTNVVVGRSYYVPNVPPVLFRVDVSVHSRVADVANRPLSARIGVGYTFLAGRHLTDDIIGPTTNVLNASAMLRYANVEVGVDAFNLLALHSADDAAYYVSNWSTAAGTRLASAATHLVAAPPLTVMGTIALYF